MPDFKTPGVYVAETSFRTRSIEGASTSTAAFIGPTLTASSAPSPVTAFVEFEQQFGGLGDLEIDGSRVCNHIAHAASAFFDNGGERLYVARVEPGASAADYAAALETLRRIKDISIVAAPGYSARADAMEIQQLLIDHVEKASDDAVYRFAVLDSPPDATVDEVLAFRESFDSSRAALYYPWLIVDNPLAVNDPQRPAQIELPPSGFICGVYARVDTTRGVWKAPANEPLKGVLGLQLHLNDLQQGELNLKGVNCIRAFAGRGIVVWGARTASSDPQWKYVSIRRYILYLEQSISAGLHWAAFEPNAEKLWVNVRHAVENFLINEWRGGALMGTKAEQACFVRCDRSTMTQNDIDNGRLIVEIGIAPVRPAEFVILRIGHRTAIRESAAD